MRRLTILLIAGVTLASSCSSGATDTTTTTTSTATTTLPSTTTVVTTVAESDSESLMLVAFGDSVLSYPSVDEAAIGAYAAMLEEEFGVSVDVWNLTSWGSTPTDLLTALASEPV